MHNLSQTLIARVATYSNLENHPRLIRARDPLAVPKIRLDPKTGFPFTTQLAPPKPRLARTHPAVYALQEDERDVPRAYM
jgi:protein LTV1